MLNNKELWIKCEDEAFIDFVDAYDREPTHEELSRLTQEYFEGTMGDMIDHACGDDR